VDTFSPVGVAEDEEASVKDDMLGQGEGMTETTEPIQYGFSAVHSHHTLIQTPLASNEHLFCGDASGNKL
jgi:hypothetical protein